MAEGMIESIATLNSAARTLLVLGALAGVSVGGWMAWDMYTAGDRAQRDLAEAESKLAAAEAQIKEVTADNERLKRRIVALQLLKVEERFAELTVLDQRPGPVGDLVRTKLEYVEVDAEGQPIAEPKIMEIEGDMVYVDYLIAKFDFEFTEDQDPLRQRSLILFNRIFGEHQPATSGYTLDPSGTRPPGYQGATDDSEEFAQFEREIWDNFWEVANDPDKAQQYGIRSAHGEAVSIRTRPGKRYQLMLQSSGGLSIKPVSGSERRGPPSA